ncbi:MAG: 30S ribosomal protein S1 [Deltaproteobacteria bacterium]|nr:30S ribosomal protein S1 [Deltaproteobacteria bacterium]
MSGRDDKSHANNQTEGDFGELFGTRLKEFQEGDIVKGKVIEVTKDFVMIDIGYKSEGMIAVREFLDKDGKPTIKAGDDITVLIDKREDDSGVLHLSKAKADTLKIWDVVIESNDKGTPVEGTVTQRIKGGFYVDVDGITAFLPGSQVDLKPVRNPDALIGKKFFFRVIKYNRRKNNVIVSRRAILEEEREKLKKLTLENIEEGNLVEGIIKNVTDYGAFIDLGGIDGLVHLTDLSWGKVTHPSQILNVGDKITVKILKYNKEDGKVSLGLKQTRPDPWLTVKDRYPAGSRVKGKVVNITDYGAFIEIEDGLEGLAHISEMSWAKIKHPSQKVKVGDAVDVVILDIDPAAKRISLGMKQAEPNPWDGAGERYPKGTRIKGTVKNITDFGLFIGVEDGIDGLVHISDLSWKKIKHPSEIFKKGQEIEAVVLNVDALNRRFSLSTKVLEKNPWQDVEERYKPGMISEGRVTSVAEFGAFVEIAPGLEGLVHISELNRGKKKGAEIHVGDIVEVEILNVDPEDNKIGLSIRAVKKPAKESVGEASQSGPEGAGDAS